MSHLKEKIPETKLDLHDNTVDSAFILFDRFVRNCHENGTTRALIITGRGSGIINQSVKTWCDSLNYPWIQSVTTAPTQWGGIGALVIRIAKNKSTPS